MTWEEKIRYLLRAALRAEGAGDWKVAETLRRMALEAVPVEASPRSMIPKVLAGYCRE